MWEPGNDSSRRQVILLGIFALCLLFFAFQLYDVQVVHQAEYLAKSTTQVTTTQTISASRGIITDRNGKPLVTNQASYVLSFDPDMVKDTPGVSHAVSASRALLRLLKLCREQGVSWTDNLPISAAPPYLYTTGETTGTQRARLQAYLQREGWSDTELTADSPYPRCSAKLQEKLGMGDVLLPAGTLLQLMREDLGVDPAFTDEEARMVVGVLYELKLRSAEITYSAYTFVSDVSVALLSILNDGDFQGAAVTSRSLREYNTDYAAHILGRLAAFDSTEERDRLNAPYLAAKAAGEDTTGLPYYRLDDLVGKDGAEAAFESYLRGIDGKKLITTNREGKITSELYSVEPQPGGTVALTIDIDFQGQVEDYLAQAVQAMNGEDGELSRGAAAAVVSVKDSDILALASYPTYSLKNYNLDYNQYLEDPAKPFTNRAINGRYAPGSTFKLCTAVAALESGIITPASTITDRGRYMYYATGDPATSYTPACWLYRQSGGTHGTINVSQAIYHSCNYFFYEVGRLMGIETLNKYATAFGLGQRTGIELSDSAGILDSPEYRSEAGSLWVGGTVLQCAIGQGDSLFTPLQLANYVATLVRGGQRYNAHLLETVTSYDGGETVYAAQPEAVDTVEISASTLAAVKKGMGDLTTSGSISRYFDSCVVSAGAKTGSAQTAEAVANGVFVCFAPFDDPEVAVAIVIEKGGSGAALAATAVNILNAWFSTDDIGAAIIPEGELLP